MSKSRREALKAMGKCAICGKNPAEDGYKTCLACRMERREKGEIRSQQYMEKHKAWFRRLRDLRYAFGVCIVCGKRDVEPGSHECIYCKARSNLHKANKRLEQGIMPRTVMLDGHHCPICGKPEIKAGFKVCERCYEVCKRNMLNARAHRKGKNYFEKQNAAFWLERRADDKKTFGAVPGYLRGDQGTRAADA